MSEHIRKNVIDWLKLLSSPERQQQFEKEAAGDIAGDELVEVWFGGFFPDDKLNRELYSAEELAVLNEFHTLFDRYASNLPTKLEVLQKTKEWQEIQNAAKSVLLKCGW